MLATSNRFFLSNVNMKLMDSQWYGEVNIIEKWYQFQKSKSVISIKISLCKIIYAN